MADRPIVTAEEVAFLVPKPADGKSVTIEMCGRWSTRSSRPRSRDPPPPRRQGRRTRGRARHGGRSGSRRCPRPEDGESVRSTEVRPLVDEIVAAKVDAIPLPRDGKDVEPEAVLAMVAAAVEALPKAGRRQERDDRGCCGRWSTRSSRPRSTRSPSPATARTSSPRPCSPWWPQRSRRCPRRSTARASRSTRSAAAGRRDRRGQGRRDPPPPRRQGRRARGRARHGGRSGRGVAQGRRRQERHARRCPAAGRRDRRGQGRRDPPPPRRQGRRTRDRARHGGRSRRSVAQAGRRQERLARRCPAAGRRDRRGQVAAIPLPRRQGRRARGRARHGGRSRRGVAQAGRRQGVSLDAVRPLVDEIVAPRSPRSPSPATARTSNPSAVLAMVAAAVEALPKPVDGKSVSLDDVRPLVDEIVAAKVRDAIPLPPRRQGRRARGRARHGGRSRRSVAQAGRRRSGSRSTMSGRSSTRSSRPRSTRSPPPDGKDVEPETVLAMVAAARRSVAQAGRRQKRHTRRCPAAGRRSGKPLDAECHDSRSDQSLAARAGWEGR